MQLSANSKFNKNVTHQWRNHNRHKIKTKYETAEL